MGCSSLTKDCPRPLSSSCPAPWTPGCGPVCGGGQRRLNGFAPGWGPSAEALVPCAVISESRAPQGHNRFDASRQGGLLGS